MFKKLMFVTFLFFITGCEKEEVIVPDPVVEPIEIDLENMTIEEIVQAMTIQEKAGQMIQAERGSIQPHEVTTYHIGSVLSGGGSHPSSNTEQGWNSLVSKYQNAALNSSAGIPLIYGIDAVHGHNNLAGAVLFPHNIGLGAANDADLMFRIGKATSEQLVNTGIHWNFTPTIAVAQDPRWGRYYESFSENNEIHDNLVSSYILGLQENNIVATAKHFIGDGATVWDESSDWYQIDRGDVVISLEELREIYLPPYIEAIEAGVLTVMTSYNSFQGDKLHGHDYLINEVLKGELGFTGYVVSDWEGIHELPGSFYQQVVRSVNAGNDILMEPHMWKEAYRNIITASENGDISMERIDDAVTRILTVKKKVGLFDNPFNEIVDTMDHYAIAREAVRKSSVLLKNEGVLPLNENQNILLIGKGIDSTGIQSGGWSFSWQGGEGENIFGTTLLDGFNSRSENIYTSILDVDKCDVVVLVVSEAPYAEGIGDNGVLSLSALTAYEENEEFHQIAVETGLPVVTVMISGRPLIVTNHINEWDAFVMAHLPGSAGEGVTDLLYGEFDFTGKLPYTWLKDISQAGQTVYSLSDEEYQFDYGYGLDYK